MRSALSVSEVGGVILDAPDVYFSDRNANIIEGKAIGESTIFLLTQIVYKLDRILEVLEGNN